MHSLFIEHTDEDHNFMMSFTDLRAVLLAVFIVVRVV